MLTDSSPDSWFVKHGKRYHDRGSSSEKVRPLACGREDDQKEDDEEEPLFSWRLQALQTSMYYQAMVFRISYTPYYDDIICSFTYCSLRQTMWAIIAELGGLIGNIARFPA